MQIDWSKVLTGAKAVVVAMLIAGAWKLLELLAGVAAPF